MNIDDMQSFEDNVMLAKSNFVSFLNHKLKTPLNGIIGMSDLLSRTTLDDKQKKYVDTIHESGEELGRIINNTLELSKLELRVFELKEQTFCLKDCLEEIIKIEKTKANFKNIDLCYSIEEDISNDIIGDPYRLKQILLNLVNNAIRFTNTGKVCIHAREIAKDLVSTTFEFQVKDTGTGIPSKKLEKLFTPKFNENKEFHLGLIVCSKLIEKMQGTIWVESQVGVGTTFYFTVKLKNLDKPKGLEEKTETIQGNNAQFLILVAEDNIINQNAMVNMLEETNFQAEFVSNGYEVLNKLKEKKYNLIFLDLKMPKLDGLEAIQKIRNTQLSDNAPIVIAMSSNSSLQVKENCFRLGMQDFLIKPFQKSQLKKLIEKWIHSE